MFKMELLKILKSKISIVIIVLILLIPLVDLLLVLRYSAIYDALQHPESYPNGILASSILHPTKAAFLSGSSMGKLAQMLLIWLIPFYLLLYYGGFVSDEYKIKYINIIYTKITKRKYILNKYLFAFSSTFVIISASMLLNLLISFIIFREGTSFSGRETYITDGWSAYSIHNPYAVYMIYILLFSVISSIYSVFCISISFVFKDKKIIYPVAFMVWILLIMNPYSLTYLFQPFIEYGLDYMLKGFVLFIIVTMPMIFYCYRYVGIKDEI